MLLSQATYNKCICQRYIQQQRSTQALFKDSVEHRSSTFWKRSEPNNYCSYAGKHTLSRVFRLCFTCFQNLFLMFLHKPISLSGSFMCFQILFWSFFYTSGVSAGHTIPHSVLCSCRGFASLPSLPIGELTRRRWDKVDAKVRRFSTYKQKNKTQDEF